MYHASWKNVNILFCDRGINPYCAGVDFSRQNLTSVDVRFWRLKSIPALFRVKIFIMAIYP